MRKGIQRKCSIPLVFLICLKSFFHVIDLSDKLGGFPITRVHDKVPHFEVNRLVRGNTPPRSTPRARGLRSIIEHALLEADLSAGVAAQTIAPTTMKRRCLPDILIDKPVVGGLLR